MNATKSTIESTNILRKTFLICANVFVAVIAFCGVFLMAIADLPEEVVVLSISALVGLFVAYGTIVAALLVFGSSRLPFRLLGAGVLIGISIYLIFACFGALNNFAGIANHFLAIVMVAMLCLGALQNIFGLKIETAQDNNVLKPRGQLSLWVLFAWSLGFALLATTLRSESVTTESLIGTCLASFLTTSITFTVVVVVLRRFRVLIAGGIVLSLVALSSYGEIHLLNFFFRPIPPSFRFSFVLGTNCGALAAAILAATSLKLLNYRLISVYGQREGSDLSASTSNGTL